MPEKEIVCCSLEGSGISDFFYRLLYKLGEWIEDELVVCAQKMRTTAARHFGS